MITGSEIRHPRADFLHDAHPLVAEDTPPSATVGTSPFRMCRSVPQMVVLVILTMASPGDCMTGLGLSSSLRLPGP